MLMGCAFLYCHASAWFLFSHGCNLVYRTCQLAPQNSPTEILHMLNIHKIYLINLLYSTDMTVWRNKADLWLAPWLWTLWAFCTSSSSLCFSSCSWSSVSGECCCWLSRVISWSRASFSRSNCRQSQSRSASARPDQLSLSNWANWCWILDILRERQQGINFNVCKQIHARAHQIKDMMKWWKDMMHVFAKAIHTLLWLVLNKSGHTLF